jgi:4-hydroxybenzoate polyprenyltransferase
MAASTLSYHLYTLFLFTKSDMKALVLPAVRDIHIGLSSFVFDEPCHLTLTSQTLFAAAAAPSWSISRLLHALLWLWVHTLQFGLANQTHPQAIAEDVVNNPYRPLPTGRISVRTACILRWMIIPLCLLLSAVHGPRTIFASCLGSLYILAYNEGGGARSHWLVRNALNAVGFAVAKAGATLITCTSVSDQLCFLETNCASNRPKREGD